SKEILLHIRDLFRNHAQLENAFHICQFEWHQRNELGPQARDEIIALFDEEIARRAPQGVELVDLDNVDLGELGKGFRLPPLLDFANEDTREMRRMMLVAAVLGLSALAQLFPIF